MRRGLLLPVWTESALKTLSDRFIQLRCCAAPKLRMACILNTLHPTIRIFQLGTVLCVCAGVSLPVGHPLTTTLQLQTRLFALAASDSMLSVRSVRGLAATHVGDV